ncbi:MAG TPA: 2-oxoacid:acceptor oxidoreductase family protein [Candidatus Lokiarchaeia archaeon]|nr:2-oxoacid:acceptor oxidoreductase family protein [Candidatus Lokiarchaeia archaeon]
MQDSLVSIAFYGRGGQGAVTAATILAKAAYKTGKYPFVMAFPTFGPERRGAPVSAFARISSNIIYDRSKISSADILIIMDPSILKTANPVTTLKTDGLMLVNSHELNSELREKYAIPSDAKLGVVDIVKICFEINLMIGGNTPIFNTPVLGAISRMYDAIPLDIMLEAIKENFTKPDIAELNAEGARLAYEKLNVD